MSLRCVSSNSFFSGPNLTHNLPNPSIGGLMGELRPIKDAIDNHRKLYPGHRCFPKEIWQQITPLASKYDSRSLAEKLGISHNGLFKRIKALSANSQQPTTGLVPIPILSQVKKITLALPHNITLRIDL